MTSMNLPDQMTSRTLADESIWYLTISSLPACKCLAGITTSDTVNALGVIALCS
ncbi:hypothetical protein E9W_02120 [Moraxella catarrhalis CO72]|nr:hypothetical protein E9W_02120 [Moraxella catarrhalis CO72]